MEHHAAAQRAASSRSTSSSAGGPADPPLFAAQQLTVSAGGQPLLIGVDLTLQPNEITAVTGPSGCGKTTLLRVLAGLVDVSAGELRMCGLSPAQVGWPSWRRRAVWVAQRPILLDASVRDNLSKPFEYRSSRRTPFPESKAAGLLDELGLPADAMGRAARSLSEGQQQRLILARALLLEPDVLLLDEPTSALDPAAARRVEEQIRSYLEQQQAAALVVTHDPRQAMRLGDHQVALERFSVDGANESRQPAEQGDG